MGFESDFLHYFNATKRLKRENEELQRKVETLEKDLERLRGPRCSKADDECPDYDGQHPWHENVVVKAHEEWQLRTRGVLERSELMTAEQVWFCKIGSRALPPLPQGADWPMRQAVQTAFRELLGVEAEATFSGWGEKFSESERAVIENRMPDPSRVTVEVSLDELTLLRETRRLARVVYELESKLNAACDEDSDRVVALGDAVDLAKAALTTHFMALDAKGSPRTHS